MRQENPLYSLIRDWQKKDRNILVSVEKEKQKLTLLFSSIHIHKAYSKTLKPQKIFISPFFRGIKTINLLLSTLLRILYVQNTIYKVLLKVINEHLLLLLESGFYGY